MNKNKQAVFFVVVGMAFMVFNSCGKDRQPKLEEITGDMPEWASARPPEGILWGTGTGDSRLSTLDASCEQAAFNARVALCKQICTVVKSDHTPFDGTSDRNVIAKLNVYSDSFYYLLSEFAASQASFELSEYIKVERRGRSADGTIWYLVSLKDDNAKKLEPAITDYQNYYFSLYEETMQALYEN